MTLLSPSFILTWAGGVYGSNEGGDNHRGRLGFWKSLLQKTNRQGRPCWTPAKSSTIHAFENIRVYVEYSHCQLRIYGLNASLRHVQELQVPRLPEVLLVHWTCARDKAYLASHLLYLPALTMYHLTYDTPEGFVLVLLCTFRSSEVPVTDTGSDIPESYVPEYRIHRVLFPTGGRTAIPSGRIRQNLSFGISFLWLVLLDSSNFCLCEGTIHLTSSSSVPYVILCEVQVL
jgi:hypothetical protein